MTMQHPFVALEPEYRRLLAAMRVTRTNAVEAAAEKILRSRDRYAMVAAATGVPAALIGALDLRESDCDITKGLGQGDRWDQVSHNVPRGKGPFPSWIDAAVFYVIYDHLNDMTVPWSMTYACWKAEAWNGFGPRAHGIHSGYLWAGTNLYGPPNAAAGKYVADGQWDGAYIDRQLGVIPIIVRLGELEPSWCIQAAPAPAAIPPPPVSIPAPVGIDGGKFGVKWLQNALNHVLGPAAALRADGSYGRRTRAAVRLFQRSRGLEQDGLAGPLTLAALENALAA